MVGGRPAQISAQENEKVLSIIAVVFLLAEPLGCAGGALELPRTPVENH